MSVQQGEINFIIYSQDDEPRVLTFIARDSEGNDTPIDLAATFDEIILQIRDGVEDEAPRFKNLSLGNGITIVNTNQISFNLSGDYTRERLRYDLRLRYIGTSQWITYIKGELLIDYNISDVNNI